MISVRCVGPQRLDEDLGPVPSTRGLAGGQREENVLTVRQQLRVVRRFALLHPHQHLGRAAVLGDAHDAPAALAEDDDVCPPNAMPVGTTSTGQISCGRAARRVDLLESLLPDGEEGDRAAVRREHRFGQLHSSRCPEVSVASVSDIGRTYSPCGAPEYTIRGPVRATSRRCERRGFR